MSDPASVILYDGLCGLCNRLNIFVLKRDRGDRFHFASLQSPTARSILEKYGKDPQDLDTIYLITKYETSEERLLARSSAMIAILSGLHGIWPWVAAVLKLIPGPIRDLGYRFVARTRYRIFGKYDTCPVPKKEWKSKFIDL